jgi:hypothetical protein
VWIGIGYPQGWDGGIYPFGGFYLPVENALDYAYPLNNWAKFLLAFNYVCLYVPPKKEVI